MSNIQVYHDVALDSFNSLPNNGGLLHLSWEGHVKQVAKRFGLLVRVINAVVQATEGDFLHIDFERDPVRTSAGKLIFNRNAITTTLRVTFTEKMLTLGSNSDKISFYLPAGGSAILIEVCRRVADFIDRPPTPKPWRGPRVWGGRKRSRPAGPAESTGSASFS